MFFGVGADDFLCFCKSPVLPGRVQLRGTESKLGIVSQPAGVSKVFARLTV